MCKDNCGGTIVLGVFPRYAIVPTLASIVTSLIFYVTAMLLPGFVPARDLSLTLDAAIPVIPEMAFFYGLYFIYLSVSYPLMGRRGKENFYRLISADFVGRFICLLCFLFFPATMTRPEIVATGIWNDILRFIYAVDQPKNLFPSMHVFISCICMIGVCPRTSRLPAWYRALSAVLGVLIIFSTLAVKQHLVADVIAGIALAILLVLIFRRGNAYLLFERLFTRINKRLGLE